MTGEKLAKEIRTIITSLCEVCGKQDKYALECCDELDKKLEILDMLKILIGLSMIYNGLDFKNMGTNIIRKMGVLSKEEREKIKEWLKEGTK